MADHNSRQMSAEEITEKLISVYGGVTAFWCHSEVSRESILGVVALVLAQREHGKPEPTVEERLTALEARLDSAEEVKPIEVGGWVDYDVDYNIVRWGSTGVRHWIAPDELLNTIGTSPASTELINHLWRTNKPLDSVYWTFVNSGNDVPSVAQLNL